MQVHAKTFLTVLIVGIGVAVLFLDSRPDNAGPDWMWRLGRRDPFRKACFPPDGSLRRFFKPAILLWLLLGIALLWIALPTD
jgi:hypothetical protein